MNHFGNCPRCNSSLHTGITSGNIHAGGLAVCTGCGWYESKSQSKARIQAENKTIATMIGITVSILLVAAHMLSWGSHAFSIPLLKAGQLTGMLSIQGYDELAQICTDLGKVECATKAHIENYRQNYGNNRSPEPLAKLARLQVRLQDTNAAMQTFGVYFKSGGADGEAALLFGQLLEQAGQDADALKMLELSITSRPTNLPIAATGAIVRIMMKQGRYEDAKERIVSFHESAGNAKGYLNTELAQVEQAIKMYRGSKISKR